MWSKMTGFCPKRSLEVDNQGEAVEIQKKRRQETPDKKHLLGLGASQPLAADQTEQLDFSAFCAEDTRLHAIVEFAKFISEEQMIAVKGADRSKVITDVVRFLLVKDDDPAFQDVAAGALEYISSRAEILSDIGNTSAAVETDVAHCGLQSLLRSGNEKSIDVAREVLSLYSVCRSSTVENFITDMGVYDYFVQLLSDSSSRVVVRALDTFKNIFVSAADDDKRQHMIDLALPHLKKLLDNEDINIRNRACCAIFSTAGGTEAHYVQDIYDKSFIDLLVKLLHETKDYDAMESALWVIYCALSEATDDQFRDLVTKELLDVLRKHLSSLGLGVVILCLEVLVYLVWYGVTDPTTGIGCCSFLCKMFEEAKLWDEVRMLEDDMHPYVSKLSTMVDRRCPLIEREDGTSSFSCAYMGE